ncbi:TonB-dependent receptor domain-containing protein [Cellvibrio sp. NN19]|uniref:TonB-dependent receptor domain-containing protein n=1 Tax=Cellvibrio chitinivorans TaxID=3102792 RepID=UPI002B40E9DE|nr:TonB-dependent receptor [Cellvibrio sp. NN19]
MSKKRELSTVIQALTFGVSGWLLTGALPAFAQSESADSVLEEVLVTGSAIKRQENLEGSLPIQVFGRGELDRSGVATTGDFIETIPAMQGFTTVSDSVGGSGGGVRTASIHDIGEQYTLVLLNGRRMAPADSGGTIDLTAIPMSMLEQVDVLTDGASALYGSDAIAGVVNFQLKKEVEGTTISARYADPTEGAGETLDFDLITGFGSLKEDGYSFVLGFNHNSQEQLAAVDRDFAKTGLITVTHPELGGKGLFFNGSGNAIPGNATATYIDVTKVDDPATEVDERRTSIAFNPYQKENGTCAPDNSQIGSTCFFDYTTTIEIVPESERNSLFLNGHYKVNDDFTLYSTLVYTESQLTSRIAPYPTGNVPVPVDSQLVADYVLPYLTQSQADNLVSVTGTWRALPADPRTTEYNSDATHFVVGFEGAFNDIDYSAAYTFANNSQVQDYPTGWLLLDPFVDLVASGGLNIFTTPDQITDAERDALRETVYNGNWDSTDVTVNSIEGVASKPIFSMSGGEAVVAVGFDYRDISYVREIADANANEEILFLSKDTPYDMSRSQAAIYTEVLLPVADSIELTASLRYDTIDAVDSKGVGSVGESMDDTTYKITGRWDVTDLLALRASYGTGFKAPSMLEVAEPLTEFGVTSGNYACPFPSSDSMAQYCLPGTSQYTVYRQGNAEIKPETSEQYSAGFVLRPIDNASITIDYWNVEIDNVVERLNEEEIFANPTLYRNLFSTKTNLATGSEELAIIQSAVNGGVRNASGIDYNFSMAFDLSFGTLTPTLSGTYMLESESSLNGSSLGKFGGDSKVTFRNQIRLGVTLEQDMFTHSLAANYRSGYVDQAQIVNMLDSNGEPDFSTDTPIQLTVSDYYTINYQTLVKLMDDKLGLTFGINNLLNEEPPVSLRTNGSGHQVGWDPRYTDAFGRTLYVRGEYTF